jgi:hypothetical protein
MVKYVSEMQELEIAINKAHIKQLTMQLSDVASTKSPPQGDSISRDPSRGRLSNNIMDGLYPQVHPPF